MPHSKLFDCNKIACTKMCITIVFCTIVLRFARGLMSVERKRPLTEWGAKIDEWMRKPPKISKSVMAAKLAIAPSTFYAWLCRPDLSDYVKSGVEEILQFLKQPDDAVSSTKTVDRPVDEETTPIDDAAHLGGHGGLQAKGQVIPPGERGDLALGLMAFERRLEASIEGLEKRLQQIQDCCDDLLTRLPVYGENAQGAGESADEARDG